MIIKAALFLLVAVSVLAILGRVRLPGLRRESRFCPDCGRPRIGRGPCTCGRKLR